LAYAPTLARGEPLGFDLFRFRVLMNIRNILCFLALGLTLPLAACDSGDDGDTTSSDSNAESNDTTDDTTDDTSDTSEDETGEDTNPDVSCSIFCINFVEQCVLTGKSSEFELNDDCVAACAEWDQAGINCRNEQIFADACDQAGDMGSAC
jgi:hypothetical protein